MTRALLCATAAHADTRKEWGHNAASHVELHEPTAPGAVASITFHDALVHASSEAFTLTLDGLPVSFWIEHMGADPGERLHITVPEGYVVWPDVLQPGENQTGTAHVYPPGVAS